ncbi:MAG: histidine kinase, partial [Actinomycetes bacterium]
MIWNRRRQTSTGPFNELVDVTGIPDELIDMMDSIDAEYILLDSSERVIQSSLGISTFNIVRERTLLHEHLLRLVRATRRSGQPQETTMELPRGPVGGGKHSLFVRVTPLGENGLIAILIFDDSEMRRLDSIRRDFVANISHELKTP